MKTYGIIPSRFGSSRFPGKPLVVWVVEAVRNAKGLGEVLVTTDDVRLMRDIAANLKQ